MFDFLRGRLVERSPDGVVLDVGGAGYALSASGATLGRLPEPAAGREPPVVTLFVHDVMRDERFVLYGFASTEERALFLKLLSVSRVGPGIALSLLSAMEPGALAAAVEAGDATRLSKVRGVGRRTAERLCVELKGRLAALATLPGPVTDSQAAVAAALVALGYPRAAARSAAESCCRGRPAGAPLEELVKLGLKELQRAGSRTEGAVSD